MIHVRLDVGKRCVKSLNIIFKIQGGLCEKYQLSLLHQKLDIIKSKGNESQTKGNDMIKQKARESSL